MSSPIAESLSLRYARVVCVCVHALSGRRSGVRHPSLPRMQCNHLPSKPCTPTPRSRSLSRSVSPPQPRATRLWGMRSHRESFSLGDRGPRSRVSAGCVCVCVCVCVWGTHPTRPSTRRMRPPVCPQVPAGNCVSHLHTRSARAPVSPRLYGWDPPPPKSGRLVPAVLSVRYLDAALPTSTPKRRGGRGAISLVSSLVASLPQRDRKG